MGMSCVLCEGVFDIQFSYVCRGVVVAVLAIVLASFLSRLLFHPLSWALEIMFVGAAVLSAPGARTTVSGMLPAWHVRLCIV